jgi:hypothetical protein
VSKSAPFLQGLQTFAVPVGRTLRMATLRRWMARVYDIISTLGGARYACHIRPLLALLRHADCIGRCPLLGVTRKTFAHTEFFSV